MKTHSQGAVKEGDIHTVKGLKMGCCGKLCVDVGIKHPNEKGFEIGELRKFTSCGHIEAFDGKWWVYASLFRPLDDLYNTEIEELMNEVNERQPFEI